MPMYLSGLISLKNFFRFFLFKYLELIICVLREGCYKIKKIHESPRPPLPPLPPFPLLPLPPLPRFLSYHPARLLPRPCPLLESIFFWKKNNNYN
ncbi:hypothetical protein PUN28_008269 [Cardiocondyla obscurior]|uniref:Uncharacterized protein n=1 Tax=Cardiocondyla obscurior TaxID=286306 RepID=A0AAW2FYH8_9HYME